VAGLADRLSQLSKRAQVVFFACVAQVMLPTYRAWHARANRTADQGKLLEHAVDVATAFAVTGEGPADMDSLVAAMERELPDEGSATDGFVGAQDAWVCSDIALRVALGEFEAQNGMWYVLEPQFQATSERLFGLSDVGSDREEQDEAIALKDPTLAAAVAGVERVLEDLRDVSEPSDDDVARVSRSLGSLAT
jgi:Protein of unknown function (DUF416)